MKTIVRTDRRAIEEEQSDSPVLLFSELSEAEWNKRKCEFEVGILAGNEG